MDGKGKQGKVMRFSGLDLHSLDPQLQATRRVINIKQETKNGIVRPGGKMTQANDFSSQMSNFLDRSNMLREN